MDINIPDVQTYISLHAVAGKVSTSTRIGVSCNCKNRCQGRCRCLKNKLKCSIHCHSDDYDCGNLSELSMRTEMGLVPRTEISLIPQLQKVQKQRKNLDPEPVEPGRFSKRMRKPTVRALEATK
jgi:hypothetical protein